MWLITDKTICKNNLNSILISNSRERIKQIIVYPFGNCIIIGGNVCFISTKVKLHSKYNHNCVKKKKSPGKCVEKRLEYLKIPKI